MQQLIRGRVLGFHADPHDTQDNHRYLEDGAILVEDGLLAEREVLHTPAAPQGIGWFGSIPAAEAWRSWQQGGAPAGGQDAWSGNGGGGWDTPSASAPPF